MNRRYFVQGRARLLSYDPSQFVADWSVGQNFCLHSTPKKTKTFFAKKLSKQSNSKTIFLPLRKCKICINMTHHTNQLQKYLICVVHVLFTAKLLCIERINFKKNAIFGFELF